MAGIGCRWVKRRLGAPMLFMVQLCQNSVSQNTNQQVVLSAIIHFSHWFMSWHK